MVRARTFKLLYDRAAAPGGRCRSKSPSAPHRRDDGGGEHGASGVDKFELLGGLAGRAHRASFKSNARPSISNVPAMPEDRARRRGVPNGWTEDERPGSAIHGLVGPIKSPSVRVHAIHPPQRTRCIT